MNFKSFVWGMVALVLGAIILLLFSCAQGDDDDDDFCEAVCSKPLDCVMAYGEFGHACNSNGCCDPEKSKATHEEVSAFWYYIENDFIPEIKEIKCK